MSDNNSGLTVYELDWNSIKDNIRATLDGNIRPATWDEVVAAIEDAHPDDDLPMGVVEIAAKEGILNKKGEGLDDTYTFNRDAFAESTDDTDEDKHITDDGRQYAPAMVDRKSWILYEDGEKQVKAPWKTGTLYNAAWGMQLDVDEYPETDFGTARRWSKRALDMPLEGGDDVNDVYPGFLLQRELRPPVHNITMIDLDDCRDPEIGEILPEAMDIIKRADSYTEISMSGAGVHIFVYGTLPEWFPSSRLVEPFHGDEQPAGEQPKVEIYHRRRIAITTGNHLEGTPEDVQDAHDVIAELCEEYFDDDRSAEDVMGDLPSTDDESDFNEDSSSKRSSYFDVDPASLLPLGSYRQVGNRVQGPHPHHGSSGGSDYQSGGRNFSVENGVWTCYRHGSGGNALHLVAVMEEFIDCDHAGSGSLNSLSDEGFSRLCLTARDDYTGFTGKPPYRALLGLAKSQGLAAKSAETFDYGLKNLLTQMFKGAPAIDV